MSVYFPYESRILGRSEIITAKTSGLNYLSYARIEFNETQKEMDLFSTDREIVLMSLQGIVKAKIDGLIYEIGFQDAVYIPRNRLCHLTAAGNATLLEASAPSDLNRDPAISRFSEIKQDPLRHRAKGDSKQSTCRDSYVHFGTNFNASRILLGFARIHPGNWSSWPPHEHEKSLEEIYIYFDMPSPAFAIQMVYRDPKNPIFCGAVTDGDAVVVSDGYHPCISAPQYPASYVWILAAINQTDRTSAPNTHPDFSLMKDLG